MPQYPGGLHPPSTALGGRRVVQRQSQSRELRTPTTTQTVKPPRHPLHVCTYNVRTLKKDEDLEHLTRSLFNIKHDITCLQETRRADREDLSLPGYSIHIGPAKRGNGGIGFLVKDYLSSWIMEVRFINHRLGQLLMRDPKNHKLTISIICCYSPTEMDPLCEIDEFYGKLDELLRNTKTFISVIAGDFNGRISPRTDNNDNRIGPFSMHNHTSDNGDKMVELIYRNKLFHCNSFFQKNPHRRWTWRSPNNSHSEIDHILCNRIQLVADTTVVPAVDAGTDHRLLRCTIMLRTSTLKRATRSTRRQKKLGTINPVLFQQNLGNSPPTEHAEDLDKDYKATCDWIIHAAKESSTTCPSSDRISDRTNGICETEEIS